MNEDRFVRLPEAAKLLSVSKVTLHAWINKGVIPQPVRISPQVVGYPMSQLVAIARGEQPEKRAQ